MIPLLKHRGCPEPSLDPAAPPPCRPATSRAASLWLAAVACVATGLSGCDQTPPIRQYTINTELPAALHREDRMLGAIVPQGDQVWFFKLVGPRDAVDSIDSELREFIQAVRFVDGQPDLATLPEGWVRGGERAMRFATLLIPASSRELELSVSQLPKSGDWDEQVAMNVNRWREQISLEPSEDRWAGAQPLQNADSADRAAAGEAAAWVDLTGSMGPGPSMAGLTSGIGATGPGGLPPGHPEIPSGSASPAGSGAASSGTAENGAAASSAAGSQPARSDSAATGGMQASDTAASENPSGLKYDAPADWRAGKMSMMRLAAFDIGPEDQSAELTIIQAGGDLRGNVDRWLGQIRGDSPPSEVVDAALQDAERLQVDGRDAQRFHLTAGDQTTPESQAIDATIVPLEGGMSLFIKATGPAETLVQQRAAIGEFLTSLRLPD